MPLLQIQTNVILDGLDLDPFTSELTKFLSSTLNVSEHLVMVVVTGFAHINLAGSKHGLAAFTEVLISARPVDRPLKRKIIASVGKLIEYHLAIPSSRCFCNVVDLNLTRPKL